VKPPVFILGIEHRSGTNYLAHLLSLHSECTSLDTVKEDYLLASIDLLDAYAQSTARCWNPEWDRSGRQKLLKECLGSGLKQFLAENAECASKVIVTKTPSVRNLDRAFEFLPDARFLIIIRDGQALTASSLKSFGGSFGRVIHRWRTSAERIEKFICEHGESGPRHSVVKYEELFTDTESVLKRLLCWLGLPVDDYDFAAAVGAPVIGSSDVVADEQATVHWQPVKRDRGFDPLRRASMLSTYQRSRFAWMAGPVSRRLGYEVDPVYRRNPLFVIMHVLQDVPMTLRRVAVWGMMQLRRLSHRV
jgi:hypothetical protein